MAYFYFSIFLSAFLLFQVEPMIAKSLLPWFGGSAAVWSTAVVFFQALLTGGYAYASWLTGGIRRRGRLHLALLGLSLVLLLGLGLAWKSPITPPSDLNLAGTVSPVLAIFILLTISVGLPFFLLASNSTLVQAWFQRAFPQQTAWRLYALSNASSLVALVSYPILVEPNLGLPGQGWLWSAGYLVFAGVAVFATLQAMRRPEESAPEAKNHKDTQARSSSKIDFRGSVASWLSSLSEAGSPTRRSLLWLALSACTSILFLATTGTLTQEVAVIPFLWVLPLAIYLLTFVLAFSGERWYPRQAFVFLLVPVILFYDWAMANGGRVGIPWQIGVFSAVLFVGCMVCHGELYRLRPHPDRLPAFYLTISIGGALGGLLIDFAAPVLFKGFWELPLGVLFFCILFLVASRGPKPAGLKAELLARVGVTLLAVSVLISGVRAFLFIGSDLANPVLSERNFYGVVHVREVGTPGQADLAYQLIHGSTVHGVQFQLADKKDTPTVYYGPSSGVGLALLNHPRPAGGLRVGALGLGIGTIAAYGQPGDVYRFYEINPQVIALAEGQGGYFSFLKDSRATIQVVPGDARLSLESEIDPSNAPRQAYDVLVVDVFSGDAVPVHLLDEQAFALYLRFLKPGGVLAVHVTNAYLDLVPVVWTLADHFALARAVIEDPGDGHFTSASTWVLLSRDPSALAIPAIAGRAKDMAGYTPAIRPWTDKYSNLFQILKR